MSQNITHAFLFVRGLVVSLFIGSAVLVGAQDATAPIDPADFVDVVDNPYFARIPGMQWVYDEQTSDGAERVELSVLPEKREVMGVQTTVMRDTVSLDGTVIEDTYDYFAQDKDGNVWYFGEDVSNYENGTLKDKHGSWEAGVDGAVPGIVMFGDVAAHVGETYQQELYAGQAEDKAILLSSTAVLTTPYGTFKDVVMTYDFTPLDPEAQEVKFFAADVGEVKSVNLLTGEEAFLVDFTRP